MADTFDTLTRKVLGLPLEQRARLEEKLLESLDRPSHEELDQLWALEGERRFQAYKAGKIEAFPGEEVHREILQEIG